ncbi:hypothetical protein COS81_03850 [candidate division WWE3 bacterium CG06_land_8_20_14_3_00_42_16]|uniref:Uncharacterized protein n=2 Tax=Katanobacteria TaxID=422282 RepID=A0A2M7AM61_UNCKA|nr:MAG: hypothetical protein AUJ38_00120 [bacterium CG1_02_42_9]PIU68472.1 MAG: hypothetical protein COS81_03850 [candidate division WWE3 bacterium CG06_land_8_20_14_3_00_42_16]PJA38061.1 MAG: hypothetical protein CO181_01215 [candidate division WWE3 bacterium CG_4_9_14_3_um_filter_43_9]
MADFIHLFSLSIVHFCSNLLFLVLTPFIIVLPNLFSVIPGSLFVIPDLIGPARRIRQPAEKERINSYFFVSTFDFLLLIFDLFYVYSFPLSLE